MNSKELRGLCEAYTAVYDEDLRTELEEQNYQNLIDDLSIEIVENISLTLISKGYTAVDVLEYFANVDDEVIVEDIISLSEGSLIFEDVIDQRYVEEQLTQLDEFLGAALRVGSAAMKAAKYAPKVASLGQRAMSALGGAGKAATRVAQQGTKANAVVRPALGKAVQSVRGVAGGVKSALGGAVSKVKDVTRGVLNKLPGGSQGRLAKAGKFFGKAALGGAGLEAGARGLSALMRNKGTSNTSTKSKPSVDKSKYNASAALGGKTAFQAGGGKAALTAAQKKDPKATAADIQRRGNAALRASAGGDLKKGAALFKAKQEIMSGKTRSSTPPTPPQPSADSSGSTSPKPKPTLPKSPQGLPTGTTKGGASFERRTPTSAELSAAQKARKSSLESGKSKAEAEKAAVQAGVDRGTKLMGGPEGPGTITPPSSSTSTSTKSKPTSTNKATGSKKPGSVYSGFDMFDLVKGHLLDEGYADTEEAAIAIMANMSEEWRDSILYFGR